jgi:hypothetical protein
MRTGRGRPRRATGGPGSQPEVRWARLALVCFGLALVLRAGGTRLALVGDDINDAPAMATAHLGVAMGRHGSDLAIETADPRWSGSPARPAGS